MAVTTEVSTEWFVDNLTAKVQACIEATGAARKAGLTPMDLLRIITEAAGLDMRGLPPMIQNQIAQALAQLT